jgi:pumilio family protein 6
MVHTRDGSFVVRDFLATSGAKDRKQIVKVFKPHVMNMAEDGDAQTVLMTMFDVIEYVRAVSLPPCCVSSDRHLPAAS